VPALEGADMIERGLAGDDIASDEIVNRHPRLPDQRHSPG